MAQAPNAEPGAVVDPPAPPGVDPSTPAPARLYDYYLGGTNNFAADRIAAERLRLNLPELSDAAWANRGFHQRAASWLAEDKGIRQFIDIGAGLPTQGNTHLVVHRTAPDARVVYVDHDPMVLVHARALLRSSPEGVTSYIDADARDPGKIIAGAQDTLDFGEPVAIVMIDVLNFIDGTREVGAIIRTLLDAVPSGSYLALMQPAIDDDLLIAQRRWNQISPIPVWLRDRDEVASWLTGLELAEPGIVDVDKWRPADGDPVYPDGMPLYGAVARKP